MPSRIATIPRFGQADLSNCEREQIHLAASVQPHGALLLVREPDLVVVQASDNAAAFLELPDSVLGCPLGSLAGDLLQRIQPHLHRPLSEIPVAVRCRVGRRASLFDGLLHRPPEGGLIIELERAGPPVDLSGEVENALHSILAASSLRTLADETARIFKDLIGYDRVMVYRFDEEGHGEIFSERREPRLEPFLGNRYPATDIPQIARRLYERNRVRVLADVQQRPSPLVPHLSPLTGQDLDMSLCFLRSMSPIHIQYLKNMGVAATLVASLVVGGRLWGLVACHHYCPRFVHYESRAACELLAETVATRIAALESFVQAQAELSVRRLEQRMVEAISRDGDWRTALFDASQPLLQPLGASGAALLFEGQILTAGEVPGTQELRAIGAWLDNQPRAPVMATASLAADEPAFASLTPVASGLLAAPVSTSPGDYLLWLRPERIRTVTWGGDPEKPFLVGNDPSQLSPRLSFAQWHQLVEGTAERWGPGELAAARLIGESVADIVLQFRSVRMLIAKDQLEQISGQVRLSEQPVVVADPLGRIILTNAAFDRLLPPAEPLPQSLDGLTALFLTSGAVRQGLRELVDDRRAWRGEVRLSAGREAPRSMQLRADPVFAAPTRVLGYVLLFTDLTERRAAEMARRRFQEDVIDRHRAVGVRLDSKADLIYRQLLASIVGNAQLAALEITDGVDLSRMPDMLESIRASVARTSELLEDLIRHARSPGSQGRQDP